MSIFARMNGWIRGLFDSEQFSFQEIRRMFVPLVLDQYFIFIIGMLSTALVSSVGDAAMTAVSMVSKLGYIQTAIVSSIATGGAIAIAQAKGSGDFERMRNAIGQTASLCFTLATGLFVLVVAFAQPLIELVFPPVEPQVMDYAISYLRISALSNIPFAIFNTIFFAFRSMGDSKSSLLLTVVINVAHLILSVLFINVLSMEVAGAGMAYLVARSLGAVMALVWLMKVHNTVDIKVRHFFRFTKAVQLPIIKLGIPFAIEQVLFQGGMLLVDRYLLLLGTVRYAANAVTGSIFNLYHATAYAVTTMASTVCGQCIGAKRLDLAKKYGYGFVKVGRLVMLVTVIILYPLTGFMMQLHNNTNPLIYTALLIGVLPMPIIWCDSFVLPSAMRAAGDAVPTSIISLAGMLLGRIALGYLLAIPCGLGIMGMWWGQVLEWVFRAAVFRIRFAGENWLKKVQTD